MSLSDNVHQLCREHLKTGPDGKAYKVPALLDDLRKAVTPGRNSSGGGASGPPIPIDPDALDMIRRITKEAETEYGEMTGELWNGSLEELLLNVADKIPNPEWAAYLERMTLEWIDTITAFLWPLKPRRKLTGKTCPSCGQTYHGDERKVTLSLGCWDQDGNMAAIGSWDIECAACEARWSGEQVSWLLKALDTPTEDMARVS